MGSVQQPLEVISPSHNLHCYSKRHRRPNVRLAEIGGHSNESTKKDMSGYAIMSSESSANQGSGPVINETIPRAGEMDNNTHERASEDQQIDKPDGEKPIRKTYEEHQIGKPSEEEMVEKKDEEPQIGKLGEEQQPDEEQSEKLGEKKQPGEEQQPEKLGEKQKTDKSVEERQIVKPGEWQIDKAGEEQQSDKRDLAEQVERADEEEKLNRPAEEEHNHKASEELHSSIERVHELEADAVFNKEELKQPFENVQTKANRTQIGYQRRNKRPLDNSTLQKMAGAPESPRKKRMTLRTDSKKSRDDANASLSDVMNINSNDHNSDHQEEEHVARDDWMEVSREVTSSKEIIRKSASPRVRKNTPRKARGGAKGTMFVDKADIKDIPGNSDDEGNLSNHETVLEKSLNPGLAEGVAKWLNALGLIKYADNFEKHEVEDDVLPLLTFEDLREMGISAVGARRKMFTAIEEMEKKQVLKKL